MTKAREPRQALVSGGMFIAGMVLTRVLLGATAGFGGKRVESLLGRYWAWCSALG